MIGFVLFSCRTYEAFCTSSGNHLQHNHFDLLLNSNYGESYRFSFIAYEWQRTELSFILFISAELKKAVIFDPLFCVAFQVMTARCVEILHKWMYVNGRALNCTGRNAIYGLFVLMNEMSL